MPKHYCPSCGAANEFTITAPKFCNQCSSAFNVAVGSVSVLTQPAAQKPKLVPYRDDDDYDDGRAPHIKIPAKLDVEIEMDPDPRQKAEHIVGSNVDANGNLISNQGFSRPTPQLDAASAKQRVAQWRARLQTVQRHDVGGSGGAE